jgi:sterol desaturase/sphingolipid hydroxylase (fatty acid hydroxylase superfamily)
LVPGGLHWHHTKTDHVNKNYASMLPVMDFLFGSAYMPKQQWPADYGIEGPMSAGLLGQLLQPFMPEADQPQVPEVAVSSTTSDLSS